MSVRVEVLRCCVVPRFLPEPVLDLLVHLFRVLGGRVGLSEEKQACLYTCRCLTASERRGDPPRSVSEGGLEPVARCNRLT